MRQIFNIIPRSSKLLVMGNILPRDLNMLAKTYDTTYITLTKIDTMATIKLTDDYATVANDIKPDWIYKHVDVDNDTEYPRVGDAHLMLNVPVSYDFKSLFLKYNADDLDLYKIGNVRRLIVFKNDSQSK